MNASEYQKLAMRTKNNDANVQLLEKAKANGDCFGCIVNACYGLSGEVGEFNDMIKKWIFHGKPLDDTHAKKELGDILWYVAMMCDGFGWDMGDVMQMNIDKLKARYPEGFDMIRSNNRKNDDV